jgi:hypothetical protein
MLGSCKLLLKLSSLIFLALAEIALCIPILDSAALLKTSANGIGT